MYSNEFMKRVALPWLEYQWAITFHPKKWPLMLAYFAVALMLPVTIVEVLDVSAGAVFYGTILLGYPSLLMMPFALLGALGIACRSRDNWPDAAGTLVVAILYLSEWRHVISEFIC